jgi:hypothetical protein
MLKLQGHDRGIPNKALEVLILMIFLAIWHEGDEDPLNHLSLISAIFSEGSEVKKEAPVPRILNPYRKILILHKT